jgi:hypothetical protein
MAFLVRFTLLELRRNLATTRVAVGLAGLFVGFLGFALLAHGQAGLLAELVEPTAEPTGADLRVPALDVLRAVQWLLAVFAAAVGVTGVTVLAAKARMIAETRRTETRVMRPVGASGTLLHLAWAAQWLVAGTLGSGAALLVLWLGVRAAGAARPALPAALDQLVLVGGGDLLGLVPVLVAAGVCLCLGAAAAGALWQRRSAAA